MKKLFSILLVSVLFFGTFKTSIHANEQNKDVFQLITERFQDGDQAVNLVDQNLLKETLLHQFEQRGDNVALKGLVPEKQFLSLEDRQKYVNPLLIKYRTDRNLPAQVNLMPQEEQEKYLTYLRQVEAEALVKVNAERENWDEFEAIAPETKQLFLKVFDLLISRNRGLTINDLKTDLPKIFRGLFILQQQYNFEENLPYQLIFTPHVIANQPRNSALSPYHRLIGYAGNQINTRLSFLAQSQKIYNDHGFAAHTGLANPVALVERLAQNKGKTAEEYYKSQSEAILAQSATENVFETIKNKKPEWFIPLLAQGKGAYVAATKNAITIGMTETYRDQQPANVLVKDRGTSQPEPFFKEVMEGFDHYMNFLNSVKKKEVFFVTAIDSMNHHYETNQGIGIWSEKDGVNAAETVRKLLTPLRLHTASYKKTGVGLGGVSESNTQLKAYETRLLNKNMSGVTLFSHEMTHGNDEAAMFNGEYRNHGRRKGQGPEIYARGMFEAIDNTQGVSEFSPVFNMNTAIMIKNHDGRVQANQPLNHKDKLETYTKNLMDLIAHLEAKEAKAAIESLTDAEKAIYFNKVSQVNPEKEAYDAQYRKISTVDTTRVAANSTNDRFAPFGKMGNSALQTVSSIGDLVRKDAVSGQFIPNGRTPFTFNLQTNQYDSVPLLESYYAASVAESGKNTVGDISFKRHAYEVLGWFGWEAFVKYVSDAYSNDNDAFTNILNGKAENWEDFKIQQYEKLEKLHPIENLWDEESLMEELKVAIKKDLAIIQKLHNDAAPYLDGTYENQKHLSSLSASMNFDKTATNVRKVKQAILKKALEKNNLMMTVLESKVMQFDVNYVFNFENGLSSNFSGIIAPASKKVDNNQEETAPEHYASLQTSVDKQGEWKFKGWSPQNQIITENTTFTGTWEYKPYVVLPIEEVRNNNDQLLVGVENVISVGKEGKKSAFNGNIVEAMQPRIIEVGTKVVVTPLNKQPAINAVQQASENKIKEITSNTILTEEEKNMLLKSVNAEKQLALELIEQAESNETLLSEQQKGEKAIEAIKPNAIMKPTAIEKVIAAANTKIEVIQNANIPENVKRELIQQINKLKENGLNAIRNANTNNMVTTEMSQSIETIEQLTIPTYSQVPNSAPVVQPLPIYDLSLLKKEVEQAIPPKNEIKKKTPVKTGDNSNVMMWILMGGISLYLSRKIIKK